MGSNSPDSAPIPVTHSLPVLSIAVATEKSNETRRKEDNKEEMMEDH
jgi:hypothetical protein